ncbi:polysaccharide lyase [Vitiosangium sp. GDMCC 1.1324]|uniref:polysaccharide lyase n=1 Tax=Vitiosangium sp. (strain GDMCC 1.1324) TaxID=2138576 RepID=UPI000D373C19|nr:polysaccharide lyase [Vitiosangium sp. GDMCC 1.1324]PTL82483.1 carbohydrate-binding protein [Vitiosangium sp. GDMCC 1.1324]
MSHSRWLFTVASILMGLATATPAMASTVWRGDIETGNLSQFSTKESMGADRLQVVQSPVRQGRYALRAEVRQGDDPINASGNRNELVKFDGASEGTEFYYGWSTLWPSDYPMTPNWQVFMQWHHPGSGGAPPVRFVLGCSAADCGQPLPDTLFFIVDNKTQWMMAPVTRGVWHDFVLHIKWSANSSVGFVELWYDGKLVVPKRNVRTLFNSSDTNYLKMGLYRDEAVQPTAVLFHDGLVQATTLEEAMQPRASDSGEVANTGTPQQPGAPQGTTPSPGGVASPGADTGVGAPQESGIGTPADIAGNAQGSVVPESAGGQAQAGGCSSSAASATPWVSLMGLLVLGSLTRFRRRANRRA